MKAVVTKKRCAVYTRVSTDERLDQSFNSLDAQREAGQPPAIFSITSAI